MKKKLEIIKKWLENYQPLNNWIYFNAIPTIQGSAAMNTVPGDRTVKRFIDGTELREIIFSVDMVTNYDEGTSDTNIDAIGEVDNFIEWIAEAEYPDFGQGYPVTKVEVLNNLPSMLIDTNSRSLAKYQFQVRVSYKKEVKNNA